MHTVLLLLDATINTETPPLYGWHTRIGEQVRIPISSGHARRSLHAAINVGTGAAQLLVTEDRTQREHQNFLNVIRANWRGWNIVLFEDRATQHTCPGNPWMADACAIHVRLLPRAAPELNAMDHLWKRTKRTALGDRPTTSIDRSP
jgi:hypothetical protein